MSPVSVPSFFLPLSLPLFLSSMASSSPLSSQVEAAYAQLLSAPTPERRAEADLFLRQFRDSPASQCLPVCLDLLSSPTSSQSAKFGAAAVLRAALPREWWTLPASQLSHLRDTVLALSASASSSHLARMLLATAASLFKRLWLDEGAGALLAHLQKPGGLPLAVAALDEFDCTHCSDTNSPWAFHARCHRTFEQHLLPLLWDRVAALVPDRLASTLAARILEWDFAEGVPDAQLMSLPPSSLEASLRPGPAWTERLAASAPSTLFAAHARARASDRPAAAALLACVLRLASLDGQALSPHTAAARAAGNHAALPQAAEKDRAVRLHFYSHLVGGVLGLLRELDLSAAGEVLTACAVLRRAVGSCRLETLVSLERPPPHEVMERMASLTRAMMAGRSLSLSASADPWMSEALADLLDTWSQLVAEWDQLHVSLPPHELERLRGLFHAHASSVFSCYLERRMEVALSEALEVREQHDQYYEPSAMDAQLSAVAALGRVAGDTALRAVADRVASRVAALQNAAAADDAATTQAQEQLFWLIRLLGHLLADPSEGETATVPAPLVVLSHRHAQAGGEAAADPLVRAAGAVFAYAEAETAMVAAGARGAALSPLVAEAAAWFLARWAATYLMPSEARYTLVSPTLWQTYGRGSAHAAGVLEFLVRKVAVNLGRWPEEPDVCERTCDLLLALVDNPRASQALPAAPSWAPLASSVAAAVVQAGGGAGGLARLADDQKARLMRAVCQAAAGAQDRRAYLAAVLGPVDARLRELAAALGRSDERLFAALTSLLALLRGVAACRGAGAATFELTFGYLSGHFPLLVRLVGVPHPQRRPETVRAVLGIFSDLAEAEMPHMTDAQGGAFLRAALELVRAYGAFNGSFRSGGGGGDKEDEFEDMHELLQLLLHVEAATEEPAELSTASRALGAEAVLTGLGLLLPHVSGDALRVPAVSVSFFQLLAAAVAAHSATFARVDDAARGGMVAALEAAARHPSPDTSSAGLEAVRALGEFHCRSAMAHGRVRAAAAAAAARPGRGMGALASRRSEDELADAPPSPFGPDVPRLMAALLDVALFEAVRPAALPRVVRALLPLVCADEGAFRAAAEQVLGQAGQGAAREAAVEALGRVAAASRPAEGCAALSRGHFAAFEAAALDALPRVRSAVRVK